MNLFSRFLRKNCARPAARRPDFRPSFENLEERALMTAGMLDPTFGNAGQTLTTINGGDQAHAVAIQSDGKIVVAGIAGAGGVGSEFAVVRYNADGTKDNSFGNFFGVETVVFAQPGKPTANGVASAVDIQADGKIVAAGYTDVDGNLEPAVVRLNTDGSLDNTFGDNGQVVIRIFDNNQAQAVKVLADGHILVGASIFEGTPQQNFGVFRLNADGSRDATFGDPGLNGLANAQFTGYDYTTSLDVQADGKIVQTGFTDAGGTGNENFATVRYNADGSIDTSFGTNGRVITDIAGTDLALGVKVQSDGKIVVAGSELVGAGMATAGADFNLVRYNPDGSRDTTFGTNGIATALSQENTLAQGLALQADGKIIEVGFTMTPGKKNDFAAVRFNTNGSIDTSYGTNGQTIVDFGGDDRGQAVAIDSTGRAVVVGSTDEFSMQDHLALMRLTGDPMAPGMPKAPGGANFDELGAYRPGDGSWSLDSNGTSGFQPDDRVLPNFSPAGAGVIPVAADWTGNGRSKIGDFENGVWHLDLNDNGKLDAGETFTFGQAGDTPVPGNYFGDGTRLAVFRSLPNGAGEFLISDKNWRTEGTIGIQDSFIFGAAGDRVVVGDWTGDGITKVGVFRNAAAFGAPNAAVFSLDVANKHTFDASTKVFIFGTFTDGVVIGDWNGDGKAKVGVYRDAAAQGAPGTAVFSLDTNGTRMFDASSKVFLFGLSSDKYVTGRWAATTSMTTAGPAALPSDMLESMAGARRDPTALDSYFSQN